MSKPLRCKLGLHKYRMTSYMPYGGCGGIIFVRCNKCGKDEIETHYYFDKFWDMVWLYNDIDMWENFSKVLRRL